MAEQARDDGRRHLSVLVKELGDTLEAADVAGLDGLTDGELADVLVELLGCGDRLDALAARVGARVEASSVWSSDGSRSCAAWTARASGRAKGDCAALLRRGRWLARMPRVDAAHRAGEISGRHVEWLAKAADAAPESFAGDEEWLVAQAIRFDFVGFVAVVRHWIHCAAPDDAEDDAVDRYRKRAVHLSGGMEGTGFMDVCFEPVGRQIFAEALRRIEHDLWEADWAHARERLGEVARTADLARSDAQRRYDALVEMAQRASVAPDDGRRPVPLITVMVGTDTMARMCELSTGTQLTPGEVLPLLCDCELERAVWDSPSRPVDVGRRRRFFAGATRRAVELRDRTCTQPGCAVPAERCHIHHGVAHEHGGETTVANGEARCDTHHRHEHRHDARRRDDPRRSRGSDGGDEGDEGDQP